MLANMKKQNKTTDTLIHTQTAVTPTHTHIISQQAALTHTCITMSASLPASSTKPSRMSSDSKSHTLVPDPANRAGRWSPSWRQQRERTARVRARHTEKCGLSRNKHTLVITRPPLSLSLPQPNLRKTLTDISSYVINYVSYHTGQISSIEISNIQTQQCAHCMGNSSIPACSRAPPRHQAAWVGQ